MYSIMKPDKLNISKESVLRVLPKDKNGRDHSIMLCVPVTEFVKKHKGRSALLVLTNFSLYLLSTKGLIKKLYVSRTVSLYDIAFITTSHMGAQCTVHVPSRYDIRFQSKDAESQKNIVSSLCKQLAHLKQSVFLNNIKEASTARWTLTSDDRKRMNKITDDTLRTVCALDVLRKLGFKSKTAFKAYKTNQRLLSNTILALLQDHMVATETHEASTGASNLPSPFVSDNVASVVTRVKLANEDVETDSPNLGVCRLSPTQSTTHLANNDIMFACSIPNQRTDSAFAH